MNQRVFFISALCFMCCLFSFQAYAASSQQVHTQATLYSQYDTIDQRKSFYLVFKLDIEPKWHTYWINPGETGSAPKFRWALSPGYEVSDTLFLPPKRIAAGPFTNYGYEGVAYHLVKVTPPNIPDPSLEELKIDLQASWLVCQIDCIPENTKLSLALPVGQTNQPNKFRQQVNHLLEKTNNEILNVSQGKISLDSLTLDIPHKATEQLNEVYFFAEQTGVIDPSYQQPWKQRIKKINLTLPRDNVPPPEKLTGLLMLEKNDKNEYIPISVDISSLSTQSPHALILILLFAFLGGLILNLMPCVFPILAIKALSLAKASISSRFSQGFHYTAGIIVAFTMLAIVMLSLQSVGHQVGWGFQMQEPLFIVFLTLLFTLIALNLAGVFEVLLPCKLNNILVNKQGDFFSGVLYVLIATPCTAPFMAVALGYTLTATPFVSLLIFWALGIGLASPFLLLISLPALNRRLPKPGPWLARFKHFLALPITLTVVWLLWVYNQQAGATASAFLLTACVLLYFIVWYRQQREKSGLSVLLMILIFGFFTSLSASVITMRSTTQSVPKHIENYSPQRLNALREEGRSVFVYATAGWCITCKINELNVLNKSSVQQWFQEQGIIVMEADWTLFDADITAFLNKYNRTGVPLYVYYPSNGEPKVLPQLLSVDIVKSQLQTNQDD